MVFTIGLEDFAGDIPQDVDAAPDQVDENAADGTYAGITASAVSPSGAAIAYSLAEDAGGRFAIDPVTGVVTVANGALLDFEAANYWEIVIRASDGNSVGQQTYYVYLSDIASEAWTGTTGDDTLVLTSLGNWVLDGREGNDVLTAVDGANVTFIGGAGNDTLAGRGGNDLFQYAGSSNGLDAIDGGDGYDIVMAMADATTIGLSTLANVEAINGGGFVDVTLQLGTGDDVLDAGSITLSGIRTIRAGTGNDTVLGADSDEIIQGEGGNDVLSGGAGADILDGGTGVDTLSYAANWTGVNVNLATNTVAGGAADGDTITSFENVIGSDFDDVIIGSGAANTITAGAGDDVIETGEGNDTIRIGVNSGTDSINAGGGTDTVLFIEDNAVLAVSQLSGVNIFDASGVANATIAGDANGNTLSFTYATMIDIAGIYGREGNDTISGSQGADILVGGAGNDKLTGSGGDDIFRYEGGDEGFDALDGGTGADLVEALGYGVTIGLSSIKGIEAINGYGDTTILGSTASNTLDFSAVSLTGVTMIDGGSGNDVITGSVGDDTMRGGAGADRLTGGLGADMLTGDAGNDTFDFNAIAESSPGFAADLILDFVRGQDRIDLATIDADAGLAGNQAFTFLGSGAFTGVAGQLRIVTGLGDGYTHVLADLDGDAAADFEVNLYGTYTLGAGDFIL
jgi:Ca2+-binding RTX toxin-like protein